MGSTGNVGLPAAVFIKEGPPTCAVGAAGAGATAVMGADGVGTTTWGASVCGTGGRARLGKLSAGAGVDGIAVVGATLDTAGGTAVFSPGNGGKAGMAADGSARFCAVEAGIGAGGGNAALFDTAAAAAESSPGDGGAGAWPTAIALQLKIQQLSRKTR